MPWRWLAFRQQHVAASNGHAVLGILAQAPKASHNGALLLVVQVCDEVHQEGVVRDVPVASPVAELGLGANGRDSLARSTSGHG
jgi:hypothetical protein